MKVYVVYWYDGYCDRSNVGVFSSLDKAEEFARTRPLKDCFETRDMHRVESFVLDSTNQCCGEQE